MASGHRLSSCPSRGAKGEQFLWPKNARPRSKLSRTPVVENPVAEAIPDSSVRGAVAIPDRNLVVEAIPDRSPVAAATPVRSPAAAAILDRNLVAAAIDKHSLITRHELSRTIRPALFFDR